MGCGISKIDPEEVGVGHASAFKHHPRRHGHANVDNPVVVSESFIENGIKDEDDGTHYARKSTSSSPAMVNGIGSAVVAESDVQTLNAKKGHHSDVDKLDHRRVGRDDNGGNHEGGGGEYCNDEDDNIFIPGSPSFREYCVDSCLIKDENEGINNSTEENNLHGKRSLYCEKAQPAVLQRSSLCERVNKAAQEGSLNCEKVHGSKSSETQKKSARKGFRRPAWIGRNKK